MKKIETTLLLLIRDDEILLARKKRGFGCGKYNGVGGKLEIGETPLDAMIREAKEEIGIIPTKYEKVGIVEFMGFLNKEKTNLIFHLYTANSWDNNPIETEEMEPKWFKIKDIPYDNMFIDDKYWLPLVLDGKKIKAFF